jgi:hypothetical protein
MRLIQYNSVFIFKLQIEFVPFKIVPFGDFTSPETLFSLFVAKLEVACRGRRFDPRGRYVVAGGYRTCKARSFMFAVVTRYYWADQIRQKEMGGSCGTMWGKRNARTVLVEES